MTATSWGWLILAFPLAGSLSIALGYRRWPGHTAGIIGTGAIGLAFACAIGALIQILDQPEEARQLTSSLYEYSSAAGLDIELGILVDPLAVFMCLVVTGVSALIHLYSTAYMDSDRGYARFFSYLNFFVFSMLLLVLAGNFVLLIVGWAFVGFASYALISYWYRRPTATRAGMKAFVINVVGDVGLVLAALLIVRELGTFDYLAAFETSSVAFDPDDGTIVAICLLLLVGAFAKSAQVPLHTWLADAMEGPTPVSALIHAATMVTAGVYLIARTHPFFELAPTAADISAVIGVATLLFAATVALVVTDLKRIIAYSTISQIGYMVLGVSIGAYAAGMFHLMTHAFFKALLFMSAGSVISAMAQNQDIDRMSGFRKALPFTAVLMTIGALALAGFPGTAGFFSKDEILGFAVERGGWYWALAIGGYLGAIMTAVYSFRIIFRVFAGDPCEEARDLEAGHQAHGEPENPATGEPEDYDVGFPGEKHWIAEQASPMRIAMAVLGFGALFGGLLQVPGLTEVVHNFLEPTFADSALFEDVHVSVGHAWLGLLAGAVLSVLGVGLAARLYLQRPGTTARLVERLPRLHTFLFNKWYFDELIDAVVYRPTIAAGRFANDVVERYAVNGLVDGTVLTVREIGAGVRAAQSGYVRFYALAVIGGIVALALYFLIAAS